LYGESASGRVEWQWDNSDPFGNNLPNENPSGAGAFNFNLRFAGQYFDKETNTHQNYFRDYDPSIGRYLSSDPIGLGGGVNTFTYVGANPLSFIDPNGLSGCKWVGPVLVCDFNPPPAGITGDPNIDAAINGGSASQSSSASSSSTDSSGAKVSPGAQCMQPPGNCSPQDQKQLQNEVDEACRQPRACKPGMDQITIQVNVSNGLRCALARNRINNKCFAGGDTNHRNEAIRVWGTVANCQGMAQ
jgi:type VI secretion system secreted protein VgrG